MGSGYLLSPLMLIISTLFDLYILLVLLRFLLQMLRADFYNPVSQFIVRMTTPPLKPLRRVIPSVARQDSASIVLCLILIYAKFLLMRALSIPAVQIGGVMAPIGSTSYAGLMFLVAIIIKVVLSRVSPGHYNPVIGLVDRLAAPILRPMQRLLPPMGGLDLSPLFAILLIMVAKMLIIPPFILLGNF